MSGAARLGSPRSGVGVEPASARYVHARTVTYSRNAFIPLTNACRNRCGYCGFRSDSPTIMERRKVVETLERARKMGCKEALFTFGERPEVYKEISVKLKSWGYSTALEYLYDLCLDAIRIGMLPHSNPGVVDRDELKALAEVNASMGLMLENVSDRLMSRGMPHEHSPGKRPELRMRVLEDAGKLRIPFTTGLLIGIGESEGEVMDSLRAIRAVNERYGNIQEVIIQNFKPHPGTPMASSKEPSPARMRKALKMASQLLNGVGIQVPPNLNRRWWDYLRWGANDLGGISPVTEDYVNPGYRWPVVEEIRGRLVRAGLNLRERLPIYPRYVVEGLYSEGLRGLIELYSDEEGLVREEAQGV